MVQLAFPPLFVHDNTSPDTKSGGYKGDFSILTGPRYTDSVKTIASVPPYGGFFPEHDEAKAYANLFAAAPDLLAALRLALPYIENAYVGAFPDDDDNEKVLNKAREAIDKATGQPITCENR